MYEKYFNAIHLFTQNTVKNLHLTGHSFDHFDYNDYLTILLSVSDDIMDHIMARIKSNFGCVTVFYHNTA